MWSNIAIEILCMEDTNVALKLRRNNKIIKLSVAVTTNSNRNCYDSFSFAFYKKCSWCLCAISSVTEVILWSGACVEDTLLLERFILEAHLSPLNLDKYQNHVKISRVVTGQGGNCRGKCAQVYLSSRLHFTDLLHVLEL